VDRQVEADQQEHREVLVERLNDPFTASKTRPPQAVLFYAREYNRHMIDYEHEEWMRDQKAMKEARQKKAHPLPATPPHDDADFRNKKNEADESREEETENNQTLGLNQP
jgi:hypothetical protein